jgi:hypothetical protein
VAEGWTDYKIEATIRAGKEYKKPLVCVWFRGTHQWQTDGRGGDVTGYMFCIRPGKDNAIFLGYIDPNERKLSLGGSQWLAGYWYEIDHFTWYDIEIAVRGANIGVWIDGKLALQYGAQNIWEQGTVGFAVYRGSAAFDKIRVTQLED